MAGRIPVPAELTQLKVPVQLKAIQHYLKTAAEHDQRDPIVAYWCRLYAFQTGLKIDKKSPGCGALLSTIMDWLEQTKQIHKGNEAITNDVVAQAHLDNYAMKLFLWADTEDRASHFNKNVVKAFYTAGMIFDILTTFGELSEEILHHRKYAKWKAAYIHNCLKNGETPQPGPLKSEWDDENELGVNNPSAPDLLGGMSNMYAGPSGSFKDPNLYYNTDQDDTSQFTINQPTDDPPPMSMTSSTNGMMFPHAPPSTPADISGGGLPLPASYLKPSFDSSGGPAASLKPDDFIRAQKYCKWAGSALQYEDTSSAIENLQKALKLLTTGQDS